MAVYTLAALIVDVTLMAFTGLALLVSAGEYPQIFAAV
jgi:hypothetical protein